VAQVIYSAHAVDGVGHAPLSLLEKDPQAVQPAAAAIASAVGHLAEHPLVGRRVAGDLRELIISSGATGFIALYRYIPQQNLVRVLALRHQREVGYLP
jgi:plasmid stabilization system protein ParE